jgi:hypothetical protein
MVPPQPNANWTWNPDEADMNIDGDQSSTAGHAIRIVHLYTQAPGKSPKRREKRYARQHNGEAKMRRNLTACTLVPPVQ